MKYRPCTIHTETGTENEARYDQDFNTSPELTSSDDDKKEIKLDDLLKMVKDVGIDLMDLDSPEYDEPFIVRSDEEDEEVHVEPHAGTKDTLVPQPPSPKSIKIQELTNQACPNRIGARWTTIYSQIQTRMENLHNTEKELELDFSKAIGLGLDDIARTFSSLLLAEVDKRNLNPLKEIRVIKQLRQ
nr:hypothetical protein [Tanacetum cinerariifolium]